MLARPRSVSGRPGTAAASSVTPGRPAGRQRGGDLRGGAEPAAQGRGPARRWRRAGGCGRRPRPPRQGAAPELRREHRAPAAVPAAKAAAAPAARPPRAAPSVPSSPRGAAQRGAAAATGGPRAGRVATKPPPTPTAAALPAVGGPDSPPAQQRENERGGMRPEARGCRRRDASQLRALRDGAGGGEVRNVGGAPPGAGGTGAGPPPPASAGRGGANRTGQRFGLGKEPPQVASVGLFPRARRLLLSSSSCERAKGREGKGPGPVPPAPGLPRTRRPAPAPGTRRGQGWEAPPPGTAPASGWERRCPDPPAPPFILERGGGREIKAAPALPGAPGGGARCGGAACCRPGGALLPPIAQGRGPWEGEARAHLPDGRRCGGAGPEPPRAAEDRGRAGQKGRCRPGRERGALTHLEGRREPGCTGGGLRRSLLVWVTLNLASL